MLKPSWMEVKTWSEFHRMYPEFRCAHCGETNRGEMSIDHIKPRSEGGSNDLSNLQWLCRRCNSRKGPREDSYWAQDFFFDADLNLEACREFHRRNFDAVLSYADWFSQPFSSLAGTMHLVAGIVAAGKTLAIPVIGCALNHLIRRDLGAAYPRVDRALVLTKEQSIRDQIVADLTSDIQKYGICGRTPRVGVLDEGHILHSVQTIDTRDIWVGCVAMLFEKSGRPFLNLEHILSHFPYIAFDEPHYARDQVFKIVQSALSSVCFGFTGSPITADGNQIKRFTLFSIYDYQNATENDGSLKFLPPPDSPEWEDVYEDVDITRATIDRKGGQFATPDTNVEGYDKNFWPVKSVVERVVQYVHDCDTTYSEPFPLVPWEIAQHREDDPGCCAEIFYPVHAMITVENVDIAKLVVDFLNDKVFSGERHRFPLSQGYQADYVCSGNDEGRTNRPLSPDHAWKWSYNNGFKLSAKSARFLVVVGKGREGVSNPLCGVVGVACSSFSMVEHVQRTFGRQLRAVTQRKAGILRVPPARLDTVKVISHSAFGNRSYVEDAAKFLLDMTEALSELPTMDAIKKGDIDPLSRLEPADPNTDLSRSDRIGIAAAIGACLKTGQPFDPADVAKLLVPEPEERQRKAIDWAVTVRSEPDQAQTKIGLRSSLEEIPRVRLEIPRHEPNDEALSRFIRRHHPQHAGCLAELETSPKIAELLRTIYAEHAKRFTRGDLPIYTKLSTIQRKLAYEISAMLSGHYIGDKNRPFKLAGTAMRTILGILPDEKMNDRGKYDIPECHVILNRPEVQNSMRGWAVRALIVGGWCPNLAAGLAVPEAQEATADV